MSRKLTRPLPASPRDNQNFRFLHFHSSERLSIGIRCRPIRFTFSSALELRRRVFIHIGDDSESNAL